MDDVVEYWYCTRHHRVEWKDLCPVRFRLGPYPTRGDAENALAEFKARNDAWEAQDEEWENAGSESGEREG